MTFSNIVNSQIVLLGDNPPEKNLFDGDFQLIKGYWRKAQQSPFWKTTVVEGKEKMGLHKGTMFSMNPIGIAESKILNGNKKYQTVKVGDKFRWSFGADLEYISSGSISLELVFGNNAVMLKEKASLIGSDKKIEHFKGVYHATETDAKNGLPFVRATFYSSEEVKVYLHYVNISIEDPLFEGPKLKITNSSNDIQLHWTDYKKANYKIYRSIYGSNSYKKIGTTNEFQFTDNNFINGIKYCYVITRDDTSQIASNTIDATRKDTIPPTPPKNINTEIFDTEIKINWTKSNSIDVKNYALYRGDANGEHLREIAHDLTKTHYTDYTPKKEVPNTYVIYAYDYSGNKSLASKPIQASVNSKLGTSFSDLILPMPIHKSLQENIWGAKGVVPRDPDNGIEDSDWTYWGGTPVKGKDGKFHMNITRWPANATKGHWEWPNSTVAHVISNTPTGPYKIKKNITYEYHNGKGHNPDIIKLNDGSFLLYSLIDWEATLFSSKTINGPWKRLGIMEVDWESSHETPELSYRFYRNLSGVHLPNNKFLFVTKAGAMMMSENNNPLGPYRVITKAIKGNSIIPEKYRNSNYEDPVLWKDEVQYHMIINAFWDYRAIYLRSPDGIHWKFNSGTAYTPDNTSYVDGTRTHWYKLERPHVLQDSYGRATHLSLAVIDVPKADDLAKDNHNSKNIILPLVLNRRMELLNKKKITSKTKTIKVKILSEYGFDAQTDIDLSTIRFGANEVVDFGKGCKVKKTKNNGKDLIIEFNATGNGLTDTNFVGKLIGKTNSGELLVGYTKLKFLPTQHSK